VDLLEVEEASVSLCSERRVSCQKGVDSADSILQLIRAIGKIVCQKRNGWGTVLDLI
jgi:hypothetical protein